MHTNTPRPYLHFQDTLPNELNKSTKSAEALEEEAPDAKDTVENRIHQLSTVFSHLTTAAVSIVTKFKASASQPLNDMKAAGAATVPDAGAAAASTQRVVDYDKSAVDEIAAKAEGKAIYRAASATIKATVATAERSLPQADAVGDMVSSWSGNGGGTDAGEISPSSFAIAMGFLQDQCYLLVGRCNVPPVSATTYPPETASFF